jgi:hypothetical protein
VCFHLVRKNLDDERVVFREEAEGMVGEVKEAKKASLK